MEYPESETDIRDEVAAFDPEEDDAEDNLRFNVNDDDEQPQFQDQMSSGGADDSQSTSELQGPSEYPEIPRDHHQERPPTSGRRLGAFPPRTEGPDASAVSGGISQEEDEDDDDDVRDNPENQNPTYDPREYANLQVDDEIRNMFQFITHYTPQSIELETRLRPFIPDFIPAVGDIDAFIKVPRPDGQDQGLGIRIIDEPSAKQSDSTVMDLTLRAVAKQTSAKAVAVKTLDNADKNTKAIDKWIKDISDLHRSKPPPTVHYSKPMPDIDSLMQEHPVDFEDLLRSISLPTAELDCSLKEYVDIVCGLLDIPIYKSRIQSLHVLFTLFSAFKQSQHFQTFNQQPQEAERLVIEE
ncbi:unnamed protein product [Cyprideis torosa]|uniref:Intraflagellar transport protein 46 homolog n=1 Tax=Cyprideis torosa TaxID=163714 RepID=A0A7R8W2D9_9CRUS|nr:unnamed protein product [Cyprideis torosa]CAG0880897.1 unnamed protein product [Cyprideis torosa]